MKCSFCGKELNEGVKFCYFCGTRVKNAEAQVATDNTHIPVENTNIPEEKIAPAFDDTIASPKEEESGGANIPFSETAFVTEEKPAPQKRGKKKLVVIIAAALAAVIFFGAAAVGLSKAFAGNDDYIPVAISAYVSASGEGYVCYGNGKTFHLGSNVKEAVLTADRKRAIVLEKTGSVYWKNIKNGEQTYVYNATVGETELISVCDNMIFYAVSNTQTKQMQDPATGMYTDYEEKQTTYYSYSFDKSAMYRLGSEEELDAIAFSLTSQLSCESGAVAYAKDGEVYTYGGVSPTSVGSYDEKNDNVEIMSVSPDGDAVVWGVQSTTTSQTVIYLYTSSGIHTLDSFGAGETVSASYAMNCPTASSEELVIVCSDSVFVKKGNDVTEILLPDKVASPYAYGIDGRMISASRDFDAKDGFFVLTQSGDAYDVYMIKASGERNRIVSDIDDFAVADGMLVYERDGKLSIAELDVKDGELEDTVSIPKASDTVSMRAVGKYVYFTDDGGALYSYSVKKQETERIYADVDYFIPSDDGKTVYFVIDVTSDPNEITYGDLIRYTPKDGNERIDENVLVSSITSGLLGEVVEDGNIWYETYATATDMGYKFHSVYYNGKEPRSVITNIHS